MWTKSGKIANGELLTERLTECINEAAVHYSSVWLRFIYMLRTNTQATGCFSTGYLVCLAGFSQQPTDYRKTVVTVHRASSRSLLQTNFRTPLWQRSLKSKWTRMIVNCFWSEYNCLQSWRVFMVRKSLLSSICIMTFVNVCLCAGCTSGYTWSSAYANTNVVGGTGNGATSIGACQTACSSSANCVGIDWAAASAVGQQCFLIYTTTSGPRKNGTAAGVTHYDYVLNDCSGEFVVPVIDQLREIFYRATVLSENTYGWLFPSVVSLNLSCIISSV